MIKVFIIDDQKMFKEGLIRELNDYKNISITGISKRGIDPLNEIMEEKPDIILLDIKQNEGNRFGLIYKIKKICPECKIFILTNCYDKVYINTSILINVEAYILKDDDCDYIIKCIEKVYSGEKIYSEKINYVYKEFSNNLLYDDKEGVINSLEPDEYDVFRLIREGKDIKEIARLIGKSARAIYYKRENIMKKLGIEKPQDIYILFKKQ